MSKSPMSTSLDFQFGNRPIQDAKNAMPSLESASTDASKLHDNQQSVETETDTKKPSPVKEVHPHSSLLKVLLKKENVDSKKPSPVSASKEHALTKILKPRSDLRMGETLLKNTRYKEYLAAHLKSAPQLFFFKLRNIGATRNRSLEIMEFIMKWLDQIGTLNKYFTNQYQDLLNIIMRFNKLEKSIEEKWNYISKKRCFSKLKKDLGCETSVDEAQYVRIDKLMRFLKNKKLQFNYFLVKYRQTRLVCINESINISAYPFEEKLFEKGECLLNLINKHSLLFNSRSLKLVNVFAFIDFSIFDCRNIVNKEFNDNFWYK